MRINNFYIFEAIRQKEHGSMLWVHAGLQSVNVGEYSDIFEMIVVKMKASTTVRLI